MSLESVLSFIVLLVVVAAGGWWYFSKRGQDVTDAVDDVVKKAADAIERKIDR